ncbi:MAG: hypothetical protein WEF86_01240 [Gemmatimonadota bacterium]
MMKVLRRAAALVLATGLAACTTACTTPVARSCTLIGCVDGLNVELMGALPSSYTVTVRAGSVERTIECTPQNDCRGRIFVEGVTAARVEVAVVGAGVDVRREMTPSYGTSYPNGPDCPPACTQGNVTVQL